MFPITIIIVITIAYLLVAMWRSTSILLNYRRVQQELNQSLGWPSVSGQITSSSVEEIVWYSRVKGNSYIYYPEVNYLFTVNNKEYDGNRVRFGSNIGTSNKQEAHATTKKYPENTSVKVYFDPHGPANSVIERELADYYKAAVRREIIKLVVGIIIFALVGIYFVTL